MKLTICSTAIVAMLLCAHTLADGLPAVAHDEERKGSGQASLGTDKKTAKCDESKKESKKDPTCVKDWQLVQTGFPQAIKKLQQKVGRDPNSKPGAGVTVAQLDTGVIDFRDAKSPALSDPAVNRPLLHPNLPANQVLFTDSSGARLPLNFYYDRGKRLSGCFAERFNKMPPESKALPAGAPFDLRQPECGPRDTSATVAPRDFFDPPGFLIGSLLVQRGHGTGTMSALFQAAEGVDVVPYKFTGGVVLTQGRTSQLADAMTSAALEDRLGTARRGIDIISMSLGRRSPAPELDKAARLAEQRGIIVVAAAGQLPGFPRSTTRFPAQFPSVVAVTGTKVDLTPWRSAGRGPRNAIAAPAVGVWRSSFEERDGKLIPVIGLGEGTSFAAPLVAAAAALWLDFHGPDELRKKYQVAGLGAAFRHVLLRSVRTPKEVCDELLSGDIWTTICKNPSATWDQAQWGFGILAADKMLDLPLPDRWAVCESVYETRGAEDLEAICPAWRDRPEDASRRAELLQKPVFVPNRAARTYVSSVTFGDSFGLGATMVPSATVGVIFSGYESRAPRGGFLQGEIGRGASFKVGAGYAITMEYSPKGHSERTEVGKFPGFGPAIGFGIKAVYMRTRGDAVGHRLDGEPMSHHSGQNFMGIEAMGSLYRFRVQGGYFWSMERPRASHGSWSLGWGF